jgi:hypothetical protein
MRTFTLPEAREHLLEAAELALHGEEVVITVDDRSLVLREHIPVDPVPVRPPGYFAECYDEDDAAVDHSLASHSTRDLVQ